MQEARDCIGVDVASTVKAMMISQPWGYLIPSQGSRFTPRRQHFGQPSTLVRRVTRANTSPDQSGILDSTSTTSGSPVLLIMTHLDLLLQRGPQNGDVEGGLDEIRRTVLLDGIPANSDGTVSRS